MSTSLLTLEPKTRSAYRSALAELKGMGVEVITTSTKRTRSEQQILFTKFQLGESKFPAAKPGTSTHEFGIAVDQVPKNPADLQVVILVMSNHAFKWAGPSDRVHWTFQGSPEAIHTFAGCIRVSLPLPAGFVPC